MTDKPKTGPTEWDLSIVKAMGVSPEDVLQLTEEQFDEFVEASTTGGTERRNEMYKLLGQIIVVSAQVDYPLNTLASYLLNPEDPSAHTWAVSKKRLVDRIESLERSLPDFEDKGRLIDHLTEMRNFRNDVAHGSFGLFSTDNGKFTYEWTLTKDVKGERRTITDKVSEDSLIQRLRRIHVLHDVLFRLLVHFNYYRREGMEFKYLPFLIGYDLRQNKGYPESEPWFASTLAEMFPVDPNHELILKMRDVVEHSTRQVDVEPDAGY